MTEERNGINTTEQQFSDVLYHIITITILYMSLILTIILTAAAAYSRIKGMERLPGV